jgi:hypothetical protein
VIARLCWAARTAYYAQPKSLAARLRLLWHDFIIHTLCNRGGERCQDCGRDFPLWRADDVQWNRVMGGPWGILCAACFYERKARINVPVPR